MTIKEAYQKLKRVNESNYRYYQKNCGLKVGDKVKVLRTASNHEYCLNDFIGNIYTIEQITGDGVQLGNTFWCPFFVLEKIKEPPQELTVAEISERLGYEIKVVKEN